MKTRTTLLGFLLGFGLLMLTAAAPETALAQCCAPPPPCCQPPAPPPCCTPPPQPPCCVPPPAPPPVTPCCDTPRTPNINVHVSSVNVAVANASSRAGAAGLAGAAVYYGGGGGGGGYAPPMATGMVQLNVEQGKRMKRVAYEASRTRIRRVVIQAVCIDARQIPHAASQVRPDREIDQSFEGELYRCIAGTWLQATIADYNEKIDFSGGKTLACRKGDALYHGRDGKLECRRQTPARDCNERSLLRRFGAGIKILTIVEVERYTAYREEEERVESSVATSMSLDGGVGGTVY
ncbi:MAG: hypothetical protein Q8Q88_15485 [Phenylobacterium sp.]|uniref:hypothetical protein n=1 Tax=Phenylobacterium sp. TaxID=1871053 RepID=UPI0027366379|nr:hypothetical protein [Phenylobacterium sp.]MDP3748442.1 hypothetical protein [Phenylobacterium sp.]